jgi:hypothetical protein
MTRGLHFLFLFAFLGALPVAEAANNVCESSPVWFAHADHWSTTDAYPAERNRFCNPGQRIGSISIEKTYYNADDKDEMGMATACCVLDGVNAAIDTCEDRVVVPTNAGKWTGMRETACDAKPGGYLTGIRFFASRYESGDWDTKFMTVRCCYPPSDVTYPETCGDWRKLGDTYHWSGVQGTTCAADGGFIRGVKFSQAHYDSHDKQENQLDVNCCKLSITPTGSTSGGSTTSGTTTSGTTTSGSTTGTVPNPGGSTTTGAPPPLPPTPRNCPGGSRNDPADVTTCECLVKGQKFDPSGAGSCNCPTGYGVVQVSGSGFSGMECRPNNTAEFIRPKTEDFFPVCGAGRVPVNPTTFRVLQSASSHRPRSSDTVNYGGLTYQYSRTGSTPTYVYQGQGYTHCACASSEGTTTEASGTAMAPEFFAGSVARFPKDNNDSVAAENGTLNGTYGPVAVSKSATVNSWESNYFKTGYSQCECPNLNEKMVATGSDGFAAGYRCVPKVSADYRVLVNYDPAIHDVSGRSQVLDVTSPSIMKDSTGHPTRAVRLMVGAGPGSQQYTRRIWTCMDPMTLNSSGDCYFDPVKNACSEGNDADIAASEVSNNVSGPNKREKFLNTRNKKLACCLNQFATAGTDPVKFDCVANPIKQYAGFDALWSSADTAAQGGQMNAMVLTNAQGKELSGFYTVSGTRCNEFSEFAGTIQPGLVNPLDGVGAQMKRAGNKMDPNYFEAKGSAIPLPGSGVGSGSAAFSYMMGKVIGMSKTVPSSAADRRRCPILVRAALAATCADNNGAVPMKSYPLTGTAQQCSSASNIQVHIRVEQVWEIAGQPKFKTVDTVVDNVNQANGQKMDAADISIDRIISNKYGNECPPGQHRDPGVSEACHY